MSCLFRVTERIAQAKQQLFDIFKSLQLIYKTIYLAAQINKNLVPINNYYYLYKSKQKPILMR